MHVLLKDYSLPLTSTTHTHPVYLGNYGNKLDTNTPAQSSMTPSTNPANDGNMYYFLPWVDQKPCCMVDSQWEDCTYRIESLSIILFTADCLVQRDREEGKKGKVEGSEGGEDRRRERERGGREKKRKGGKKGGRVDRWAGGQVGGRAGGRK